MLVEVLDFKMNVLKKKLVFIIEGISIIFLFLILKNLRKCNYKIDIVYLEFE